DAVGNKEASTPARDMPDALRDPAGETEYLALFDMNSSGLDDVDADQSCPNALDVEPTQDDDDAASVDVDSIGAGGQDAREGFRAVDRDRLGDGDRTESARIQAVDDAVGDSLRDRARKGFAWRRAAARIGVVAHARYPGPRRLGVCRIGAQHRHAYAESG